jgi:polyphosphate kinase
MEVNGTTLVRLTRDAEVEVDDDSPVALRDLIREQVRQRRYEPVVHLEFGPGSDPAIREMLCDRFQLMPLDLYDMPEEVDYTTLFQIAGMQIPGLATQWSRDFSRGIVQP